MEIKIEKGIPLCVSPTSNSSVMDTLRKMEVGDSFAYHKKSISNIHVYAKMAGVKIATRTMPDKTKRVWRIA